MGVKEPLGLKSTDKVFSMATLYSSTFLILLLAAIFFTLLYFSVPALTEIGFEKLMGKNWNPVKKEFGILPFIVGTLLTSFIAIFLTIPFSMSIALFLGEYLRGGKLADLLRAAIDLLAGIPSVVYGLWGLSYLVPIMREIAIFFEKTPYGVGVLTSVLVLVLMIVPYSVSIAAEVISLVPTDLKEAAYSLGATRFEVIRHVILPYCKAGILAGMVLSFGRAMGETMAVTMLIGNANYIPKDLFSPANTMASVIANEFQESTGLTFSVLTFVGLALLSITLIVNAIGNRILKTIGIRQKEVTCE